jgi:hypothetical protein
MECCSGVSGSHTLRVDVADATGVIRLPGANESSATRSWDLNIDPNLTPGGAAPGKVLPAKREAALFIRARVDEAGHHVEDITRVRGPANKGLPRPAEAGAAFHFEITDAAGTILSMGEVADPRLMRGPMPLPGEGTFGHAMVRQASATYLIRVPDVANMRYLRIGSASPAVSKARAADAPQVIDLAGLVIR